MANSFRVGALITDDITKIIELGFDTTVTQHYDTLKLRGVNYQVTAGKTLYIVKFSINVGVAGVTWRFGYGDTAVNDSAAAPTTPIADPGYNIAVLPAASSVSYEGIWSAPAGKYAFMLSHGGFGDGRAWGIEL